MNNKQAILKKSINSEIKKYEEKLHCQIISINNDRTVNIRVDGILIPKVRTNRKISLGGNIVTKRGNDYFIQ